MKIKGRLILQILAAAVGIFLLISFLCQVFSGAMVLPQVFSIGSIQLRIYGVIMALAIASGYWVLQQRAVRFGLKKQEVESVVTLLVLCGFIGARLYHVISELSFYRQHPEQIFYIWHGGLGIYGALIGGLLGLIGYAWYRRWNFAQVFSRLDWMVPAVLIGQIIGRFGNLFNYEAFGYPTALPWRMFVPSQFRPTTYWAQSYFHPLFLYEAVMNGLILIVIIALERGWLKQRGQTSSVSMPRPGSLFVSYLFLYTMGRFLLESYRIDSVLIIGIRFNHMVSLGGVLVAFVLYYAINYRKISRLP